MFLKKLLTITAAFIFTFSSTNLSQEEGKEEKEDPKETEEEWWDNDDWDDFDWKFDFFDSYKSPTVSVTYGFSSVNLQDFSGTFADANIPELKLGYTKEKPTWEHENILDYEYSYLFISNIRSDIQGTPEADEIETNLWRFGLGWSNGYGYKTGSSSSIIPYNSNFFSWSKLESENLPVNEEDREKLLLYEGAFRFGTGAEAGLRIKVIPYVTLEAGYERSVVFERHLFWKWAGSALIEGAANWALDAFVDKILESSPYAAPVVGFVLKSALSYGIYELRQDKMNWPFDSAPPLAYDQFKFGLTFTF